MMNLPSDPRKYTASAAAFAAEVNRRFPDIADMGTYNRRHIAGTFTWSQHAWGNAIDLTSPAARGPKTPDNELHMAYLDEVAAWIRANATRLKVRIILWRVSGHYNHIHVDFHPRQTGIPPIITGPIPEEEDVMRKGDKGERVRKVQKRLLSKGYELPVWGADADYGDETVTAVIAWQTDVKLDPDGELQSVDVSLLMEQPHTNFREKVADIARRLRRVEKVS